VLSSAWLLERSFRRDHYFNRQLAVERFLPRERRACSRPDASYTGQNCPGTRDRSGQALSIFRDV
jgi:hypothetical protein